MRCHKRAYDSERAARVAHRGAGWRVRTYLCPACSHWHVANQDKQRTPRPDLSARGPRRRGKELKRPAVTDPVTVARIFEQAKRHRPA